MPMQEELGPLPRHTNAKVDLPEQYFFLGGNSWDAVATLKSLLHLADATNGHIAFGRRRDGRTPVVAALGSPLARRLTYISMEPVLDVAPPGNPQILSWSKELARDVGLSEILGVDEIHNSIVIAASNNGFDLAVLVHRAGEQQPFSVRNIAPFEPLARMSQLACVVRARLHEVAMENAARRSILDLVRVGAALLDSDAHVYFTNKPFDRLVQQRDGISLAGGMLVFDDSAANDRLAEALAEFGSGGPRFFSIKRNGTSHLRAMIRPSLDEDLIGLAGDSSQKPPFCLLLSDQNQGIAASREGLAEFFGLTVAESALAALMSRGVSLVDSAKVLQVTIHTVRSHLRKVLRKTGAKTQADLIRLIASLPG